MPSLSDPYTIATLPRVAGLQVVVCENSDPQAQTLDLGLSGSIIGSYVTRPSPKLVWSHALSPSTVVDALAAFTGSDKTFAVGFTERKKHAVRFVAVEEGSGLSIDTTSRVVGLKYAADGSQVVAVLEDGVITAYRTTDGEAVWTLAAKNRRVVFHSFMKESLLVVEVAGQKLQARLVALATGLELSLTVLEAQYQESLFAFHSGALFRYNGETLCTYSLPSYQKTHEVSMKGKLSAVLEDVSLVAAAPHRLLLADKTSTFLLNAKFDAVLDTLALKSTIRLLSVCPVAGSTLKSCATHAVATITKRDTSYVVLVPVDVGLGNLSEALGKGLHVTPAQVRGVVALGNGDLVEGAKVCDAEARAVLAHLTGKLDARVWDALAVSYLKGALWQALLKAKAPATELSVFEGDKDRTVDATLILKLVEAIFGPATSMKLKRSFVPESTIIYLLTHPLFPVLHTDSLLAVLAPHPRLARQALVTCPHLSCLAIASQLASTSDELFGDAAARLHAQFSAAQITTAVALLAGSNDAFNLEAIAQRAQTLDVAWGIMPSLIDAGGLFAWSPALVDQLLADVNAQVRSLELSALNVTLVNQALLAASSKRVAKAASVLVNVAEERQQEQLESILTLNDTSGLAAAGESTRVPLYSVEKLSL